MTAHEVQFVTYKIDNINFNMENDVKWLISDLPRSSYTVPFNIGFRQVLRIPRPYDTLYIGGLGVDFSVEGIDRAHIGSGRISIEGVFSAVNLDQNMEEMLVQNTMPAILFPYLRSALTATLSQAGINSFTLPLINIAAEAEVAGIQIVNVSL